jgi:hypothetical protein
MTPRAFALQIDELLLRGFESLDTAALSDALEAHLTRLLQSAPPGLTPRDITLLNAPEIEVAADAPPEQIARSLAQSLYSLLRQASGASGGPA